ncbi:MAG: 2-oxoglutarate dehydrogenase complex dihydrolipoyllysine-residue succinyltransferase [Flavobacteriales bacterium]|jgi:2-oxoglutarate dehydrogenase E2 component (dihydrolipoamide succinyltransferase)|nr:2-oxoglutarate dehydrogenase complex dihydrolipoyllysine-residue succinyltransferase [Flavobacteriales bacterium]
MIVEINVPSPGESITEVEIANWLVSDGDVVEKDQELCEIDSDKATLTVNAEEAGKIKILAEDGEEVAVGSVICTIDTSAAGEAPSAPKEDKKEDTTAKPNPEPLAQKQNYATGTPSPAAKKLMAEKNLNANDIIGTGKDGRITKADVEDAKVAMGDGPGNRGQKRKKMSSLRRKVAERLVAVKSETAMLTTFNEVDMKPIMDLRKVYKEEFKTKHGVGLGFMSFFTKAVTRALEMYPAVNSMIDGKEMVSFEFCDISIAVSSPKGLMVPVIRNAEELDFAGVESEVKRLAIKARDGKIELSDMTGGTFTITNGGVFGSMLSTPIINPPQSAILGMHNIVERPVVQNGEIVIRPIMYVALSYDHRIIDGKESVGFLVAVKEALENPVEILLGGEENLKANLGL